VGDVQQIERIDIDSFDAAVDIIGSDPAKWQPTNRETADHSMPYCVAAALTDGDVTLESFTDERINDPALRALIGRISMHRDAELTRGYPEGIPNRIRIRLRDGRELAEEVRFPCGHAKNPMSDNQVRQKYTPLAARRLNAAAAQRILHTAWRLEEIGGIRELLDHLEGKIS
jgi:2-methylcitrate dehydratase